MQRGDARSPGPVTEFVRKGENPARSLLISNNVFIILASSVVFVQCSIIAFSIISDIFAIDMLL